MRNIKWLWLLPVLFACMLVLAKQKEEVPSLVVYESNNPATGWNWHDGDLPTDHWFGVLENNQQLTALLAERPYLQERLPAEINWKEEVLVVAALGAAPTGGYAVRINQITSSSKSMQVQLAMKSPAPSDMVIQIITYPVDSVCLQRSKLGPSDAKWHFVDTKGQLIEVYPPADS